MMLFDVDAARAALVAVNMYQCRRLPGVTVVERPPLHWMQRPGQPAEVFALSDDPAAVMRAIAAAGLGDGCKLGIMSAAPDVTAAAYVPYGYVETWRGPMMLRALTDLPSVSMTVAVRRAVTQADVAQINIMRGNDAFVPSQLNDPAIRVYFIEVAGVVVAMGQVVCVPPDVAHIFSVYTAPAYRRRGFAAALMAYALMEALASGATQSMLTASEMGEPLYKQLGYRTLLYLQWFYPTNNT